MMFILVQSKFHSYALSVDNKYFNELFKKSYLFILRIRYFRPWVQAPLTFMGYNSYGWARQKPKA